MLSGVSLVVLGCLQYINYEVIHFIEPEIMWFVLVSVFTFCFFNFKKNADCFAGDVGSMAMGYILFFLIIRLVWTSNDFKWIILLGVFLTDGGLTIVHRIFLRENIFLPHRKHAYEIMANELKIPHLKVAMIYMIIQVAVSVWYILMPTMVTFIAIFIILSGLYFAFMYKFYHLHEETLALYNDTALSIAGKTVIVVGENAKKNVKRYVKDAEQVRIIEVDQWDERLISKFKPSLVLFE